MKTAKYETMRQVVSVFSLQSDFSLCIYKYKSYCTESLKIDFLQKHICCKSIFAVKVCLLQKNAFFGQKHTFFRPKYTFCWISESGRLYNSFDYCLFLLYKCCL